MAAVSTGYRSSTNSSGISRLALMQERMRENIRQEKESKMLEMVARRDAEREDIINRVTKTSISSLSSSMNSLSFSTAGQGRVRKMLEERRNNPQKNGYASPKGYDKSYPLDPVSREGGKPPTRGLMSNGRGVSVDRNQRNNDASMARSRSQATIQKTSKTNSMLTSSTRSFEGLKDNNYNKSTSSLMERRSSPIAPPTSTKSSPGYREASVASSWAPTVRKASFGQKKPVIAPRPPPRRYGINSNTTNRNNVASSKSNPQVNGENLLQRQPQTNSERTVSRKPQFNSDKNISRKPLVTSEHPREQQVISENILPRKTPPKPKPVVKARTPLPTATQRISTKASSEVVAARKNDGMPSCSICGRTFASDRLEKHQQICSKSKVKSKKRKVFDPTKMRTEGTDAEKYIARGYHKKPQPKKKSDWRKKHNALIQTLRAAKGVPGYVAPPVDTTDYIQCPHCGRKFNVAAADRHIPKCANIQSNKKR